MDALVLFRRGMLSHCELSHVLGLDRFATDAYLKQHNILEGSQTMADIAADGETLDRIMDSSAIRLIDAASTMNHPEGNS